MDEPKPMEEQQLETVDLEWCRRRAIEAKADMRGGPKQAKEAALVLGQILAAATCLHSIRPTRHPNLDERQKQWEAWLKDALDMTFIEAVKYQSTWLI